MATLPQSRTEISLPGNNQQAPGQRAQANSPERCCSLGKQQMRCDRVHGPRGTLAQKEARLHNCHFSLAQIPLDTK